MPFGSQANVLLTPHCLLQDLELSHKLAYIFWEGFLEISLISPVRLSPNMCWHIIDAQQIIMMNDLQIFTTSLKPVVGIKIGQYKPSLHQKGNIYLIYCVLLSNKLKSHELLLLKQRVDRHFQKEPI